MPSPRMLTYEECAEFLKKSGACKRKRGIFLRRVKRVGFKEAYLKTVKECYLHTPGEWIAALKIAELNSSAVKEWFPIDATSQLGKAFHQSVSHEYSTLPEILKEYTPSKVSTQVRKMLKECADEDIIY